MKEYIILNSTDAPNEFSFMFQMDGLEIQTVDNETFFMDDEGIPVFMLGQLFAVDGADELTNELSYSFTPVKGTTHVIVTVTLSEDYLSAPDRVFPVVIDPSIMISSVQTADACVMSYYADYNYYTSSYLRTGYDSDYGIRRSYIRFNIPVTIPEGSVTSASLDLEKCGGVAPTVRAYRCTSPWSSSTLTWANKPGFNAEDFSGLSVPYREGSTWYVMDVTDIVVSWVNGLRDNNGFALIDVTENDPDHWTTFYSSDMESPHKPELHITYLDTTSIDRTYSTYSQTVAYRSLLKNRMNCYGYALHIYSMQSDFTGNSTCYRQQPGEFAVDSQSYNELVVEYNEYFDDTTKTGEDALDFVEGKIQADFNSLSTGSQSEWQCVESSVNQAVPNGWRKIALTVGCEYINGHYALIFHFYMRHSDGTWSHKPGETDVTNISLESESVITDSNIASVIDEGGYTKGSRYFLIKKSAIIDYPHQYGHDTNDLFTQTNFTDCAGDTLSKATTITGTYKTGRFDYAGDADCFRFVPAYSRTYSFTTSLTSSVYDVNMEIWDDNGALVAVSYAAGNPTINVSLSANNSYFIRVWDDKESTVNYTLYYS